MSIKKQLSVKNNLHHAYLIEGSREEILPEVFSFLEDMGVKTSANPDFYNISIDSFKIKDAQYLKSLSSEKSFSEKKDSKKIFIISMNNFLLEAQNALLKIFEEPTPDTHFFLIVPDASALLQTVVSRFYFIPAEARLSQNMTESVGQAEKFLIMSLSARIAFLKEFLSVEESDDEEIESAVETSARSKASVFLNALELALHHKTAKGKVDIQSFDQIFQVREFLRQPGSSVKSLMESVALVVPNF